MADGVQPLTVNTSSGPDPAYQLALAAHTLAIQVNAEAKMHQNECTATRVRNENVFAEIRQNIVSVDNKLDQQTTTLMHNIDAKHEKLIEGFEKKNEKLVEAQLATNRKLYIIIGGMTLLGFLMEKVPWNNLHFLAGGN
jgi:hypothetical protein